MPHVHASIASQHSSCSLTLHSRQPAERTTSRLPPLMKTVVPVKADQTTKARALWSEGTQNGGTSPTSNAEAATTESRGNGRFSPSAAQRVANPTRTKHGGTIATTSSVSIHRSSGRQPLVALPKVNTTATEVVASRRCLIENWKPSRVGSSHARRSVSRLLPRLRPLKTRKTIAHGKLNTSK